MCDGESLIITCTYVASHVEYGFLRIRNGSESIVQHRSTNNVLELTSTDFLDGDIFYFTIFDLNSILLSLMSLKLIQEQSIYLLMTVSIQVLSNYCLLKQERSMISP